MSRVPGLKALVVAMHVAALVFVAAGDSQAQGFVSPFIGYNFGGDAGCPEISDCENKNLNLGVSFGVMGNIVGFEEEIGYATDFFGDIEGVSSNVLTAMSNFMVNPKIGPVRPYALIGLGLIKTHAELTASNLFDTDNNSLGWDVGGGLMAFFGDHVGIRGEIRYFHAFDDFEVVGIDIDNEKIDFGRVSGGVVFKF